MGPFQRALAGNQAPSQSEMEEFMKTATTQRLEALAPTKGSNDKVYWRKVGVAFPLKNRPGYSLKLDFIPAASEGNFEFILVEPSAPKKAGK